MARHIRTDLIVYVICVSSIGCCCLFPPQALDKYINMYIIATSGFMLDINIIS